MSVAAPRALRVALLIETDAPRGAEGVTYQLAKILAERGHVVRPVILPNGEGWLSGRLRDEGFRVHMPRLSRPVDVRFARDLASWSREERIDVLHAHEFTFGFYAGVAGLLARTPHLITMHGGVTFAAAARRRLTLAWSARRAAATVGVSEATCVHLAHALSLPRARVTLVPNGVPSFASLAGRDATRQALGVLPGEFAFVSVGSLHAVKGHATLVDACADLSARPSLPDWKCYIAGRGDQEQSLREQIALRGLGKRVILLGLRSDIPDILSAADGWIMPSLSEGLPLALLEAMLAKLPIISTAVGGIPDLIKHQQSGLLVRPSDPIELANAMAELLQDREKAQRMASCGFMMADGNYTATKMVDRYEALYRRAVLAS